MAFFILLDNVLDTCALGCEVAPQTVAAEIVPQTLAVDVSPQAVAVEISQPTIAANVTPMTLEAFRQCVSIQSPSADELYCWPVLEYYAGIIYTTDEFFIQVQITIGHSSEFSPLLPISDPWPDMREWLNSLGL